MCVWGGGGVGGRGLHDSMLAKASRGVWSEGVWVCVGVGWEEVLA